MFVPHMDQETTAATWVLPSMSYVFTTDGGWKHAEQPFTPCVHKGTPLLMSDTHQSSHLCLCWQLPNPHDFPGTESHKTSQPLYLGTAWDDLLLLLGRRHHRDVAEGVIGFTLLLNGGEGVSHTTALLDVSERITLQLLWAACLVLRSRHASRFVKQGLSSPVMPAGSLQLNLGSSNTVPPTALPPVPAGTREETQSHLASSSGWFQNDAHFGQSRSNLKTQKRFWVLARKTKWKRNKKAILRLKAD